MRWTHLSLWILHQQNQMFSMWSAHQKKVVRLRTILRPSSIYHSYQGQWQGTQLLSPPMISTCRPANSVCWLLSRDSSIRIVQPPISGAIYPVSNFDARNECEYHWRLWDNAHNSGWCHILYWWWAQTSLLGYFFERHLWLPWAKKCLYRFEPFLHTAASTKTKNEAEHGNVFSQNRGVSQHTCYACDQPLPAKKSP